MGGNSQRTITINGEDAGFMNLIDQVRQAGEDMYEGMRKQAADYSSNLDEQNRKLQELLQKKRQQIDLLHQESKLMQQASSGRSVNVADFNHNKQLLSLQYAQNMGGGGSGGGGGGSGGGGGGGGDNPPITPSGKTEENEGGLMARLAGMGKDTIHGVAQGMGIAGFLSAAGAVGGLFDHGKEFQKQNLLYNALTGGDSGVGKGLDIHGYGGGGNFEDNNMMNAEKGFHKYFKSTAIDAESLGMNDAEFNKYAANIAQVRGIGAGSGNVAFGQLQMERGVGMEAGNLSRFNNFARSGGFSGGDMAAVLINKAAQSGLWNINKNDFTQLDEKLGQMHGLMQRESEVTTNFTGGRSAGLMTAFGGLGGRWGDYRAGESISAVDQSIANPHNEFLNAMVMQSIAENNPNGSYYDVMQQKKQGIFGRGKNGKRTIGTLLKNIKAQFGGVNSASKTYMMQMLEGSGIDADDTAITQLLGQGDDYFDNMGDAELKDALGGTAAGVRKRGKQNTAAGDKIHAITTNVSGREGSKIIPDVADEVKALSGSLEKIAGMATELISGVASALGITFGDGKGEKGTLTERTIRHTQMRGDIAPNSFAAIDAKQAETHMKNAFVEGNKDVLKELQEMRKNGIKAYILNGKIVLGKNEAEGKKQ